MRTIKWVFSISQLVYTLSGPMCRSRGGQEVWTPPHVHVHEPLSGAIFPKIKTCTFIYIPSMCMWAVKALVIFRGCAGSSEPSLLAYALGTIISWTGLFHEIKYVNIKFIKMQNRATINLFIDTCMCVCAYALVGFSMCSFKAIGSTVC